MTRVLLVTHDVSLTGAPMVALLVTRCLVEQGDEVLVVSRTKGPLLAELAALAPTRRELLAGLRRRLWLVRGLGPLAWLVDVLAATATLAWHRPDLVHLNTSASAIYVHAARWLRLPVVLHVHESDANTEMFLSRARVSDLDGVHLVACSPSVQGHLVARTGRAPDDVALLPSVPDDRRVRAMARVSDPAPATDRPGLQVGAVGSVGHRKGTDLWLEVAGLVLAGDDVPPARFTWVGELAGAAPAVTDPRVELVGPLPNPYPAMAGFDVVTLTSRDDPFPLVVLEAMLLGKPVVAFDVGSVRDQVGDGGIVVAPGDVDAFARAVLHLLVDDAARAEVGARARDRAEHLYSTSAFGRRLQEILAEATGSSGQRPRIAVRHSR